MSRVTRMARPESRTMIERGMDRGSGIMKEIVKAAWKRDRHVEFSGRTAAVGAPSEHGVSLPASPAEYPIPPADDEPSVQPPTTQPVETYAVEEPLLQKAS